METQDPNAWGRDPVSAEIDSQIRLMPDRPSIILAIVNFNKTPEEAKFRALGAFQTNYLRDFAYVCFNQKAHVALFGFEKEDQAALAGIICALSNMNMDEAMLYLNGTPALRITKPTLLKPRSDVWEGPGDSD